VVQRHRLRTPRPCQVSGRYSSESWGICSDAEDQPNRIRGIRGRIPNRGTHSGERNTNQRTRLSGQCYWQAVSTYSAQLAHYRRNLPTSGPGLPRGQRIRPANPERLKFQDDLGRTGLLRELRPACVEVQTLFLLTRRRLRIDLRTDCHLQSRRIQRRSDTPTQHICSAPLDQSALFELSPLLLAN
jgi:hypothetical protein